MTKPNVTSPALSLMAVMAEVVLWQAEHRLPVPTKLHVYAEHLTVDLGFTTRAELDAWMVSMGSAEKTRQQPYPLATGGQTLHNGDAKRWGWRITVDALVDDVLCVAGVADDKLAQLRALSERTIFSHCNWIGGCDQPLEETDGSLLCKLHPTTDEIIAGASDTPRPVTR